MRFAAVLCEDMETYGLGLGGRIAAFPILEGIRSAMKLDDQNAPGLMGAKCRPFVLCGVIGAVAKVLDVDAVDTYDPCFGGDLSLDSDDWEIFVEEGRIVVDADVFRHARVVSNRAPSPVLDWPESPK